MQPLPRDTRYLVGEDGSVTGPNGAVGHLHQKGRGLAYYCVHVLGKKLLRAQLVLETYVGPRPDTGYEVIHVDGDSTNDALSNLRWGTARENRLHQRQHGTDTIGQANGRAKMSDIDVEVALILRHHGDHTDKTLAKEYGVSAQTIKLLPRRWGRWLRNEFLALEARY